MFKLWLFNSRNESTKRIFSIQGGFCQPYTESRKLATNLAHFSIWLYVSLIESKQFA